MYLYRIVGVLCLKMDLYVNLCYTIKFGGPDDR